ncbi:MAG: hypothetical protein U1E05_06185 [Patescibacteria group bacterium]|nr:hypothetical protein [Patescibacteria group bacterium]
MTATQARRAAGALVEPLPWFVLVSTGMAFAALAGLIQIGNRFHARQGRAGEWAGPIRLLTSLAVLAAAFSVSVPGSGWLGLVGLWGIVLVEESLAWHRFRAWPTWRLPSWSTLLRPRRHPTPPKPASPPRLARLRGLADRWMLRWLPAEPRQGQVADGTATEPPLSAEAPAADVVQQLTRRQLPDGVEELAGWLRVSFAPGQRTENVHLAFCPPFSAAPQLTIKQLDGPAARMKTAQLLPYGVRIDLKLSAPAEEHCRVSLEFLAKSAGT